MSCSQCNDTGEDIIGPCRFCPQPGFRWLLAAAVAIVVAGLVVIDKPAVTISALAIALAVAVVIAFVKRLKKDLL